MQHSVGFTSTEENEPVYFKFCSSKHLGLLTNQVRECRQNKLQYNYADHELSLKTIF